MIAAGGHPPVGVRGALTVGPQSNVRVDKRPAGFLGFARKQQMHDGSTDAPVVVGSEEHKQLFCRWFLDSHDPYRAEEISWPDVAQNAERPRAE